MKRLLLFLEWTRDHEIQLSAKEGLKGTSNVKNLKAADIFFNAMAAAVILDPPHLILKGNTSSWLLTVGLLLALPVTWGDYQGGEGTLKKHLSPLRSQGFHSEFIVQRDGRIHLREAGFSPRCFLPGPQWASRTAVCCGMHLWFWAHLFLPPCFFLCYTSWGGEGIWGATGDSFRVHVAFVGTADWNLPLNKAARLGSVTCPHLGWRQE